MTKLEIFIEGLRRYLLEKGHEGLKEVQVLYLKYLLELQDKKAQRALVVFARQIEILSVAQARSLMRELDL